MGHVERHINRAGYLFFDDHYDMENRFCVPGVKDVSPNPPTAKVASVQASWPGSSCICELTRRLSWSCNHKASDIGPNNICTHGHAEGNVQQTAPLLASQVIIKS